MNSKKGLEAEGTQFGVLSSLILSSTIFRLRSCYILSQLEEKTLFMDFTTSWAVHMKHETVYSKNYGYELPLQATRKEI